MLNTDNCHLLISGRKYEHQWVQIDKNIVWKEYKVELLGIIINNERKFDSHKIKIYVRKLIKK